MTAPIPKPPKRGPKPPQPLQRKTPLRAYQVDKNGIRILAPAKPRKPLKQRAYLHQKRDPLWDKTKADWFDLHPPDLGEYYQCALCPFPVHKDETTLDHIEPKGAHPELKYVLTNLQPAHAICNSKKGSMSMAGYLARFWPTHPSLAQA